MQKRIEAFIKLGHFLSQFSNHKIEKKDTIEFNDLFFDGFRHQVKIATENNSWFTNENIFSALTNWSKALTEKNLSQWLKNYQFTTSNKRVAIVMAGNIPLVGFHDFLSVVIAGHNVVVKQSSNDKHLLPFLAKYLEYVAPEIKGTIEFTDKKLSNFDAVIATGSTNTARYFEYYFKNKPSIIRKSRNSVAVLTGNETEDQLKALGDDVFQYFGLGCRSVSKLFVPKNYQFDDFFKGMFHKRDIINNIKYANNYDYNKAVYLMSEFDILENGFLMIKEDSSYASPIASVFYEYYTDISEIKEKIVTDKDKIQCVISQGLLEDEVDFGESQNPQLWDYADGINTLDFLVKI